MSFLHAGLSESLLCSLYFRRELSLRHRQYTAIYHVGDPVSVLHHHFIGLFPAQIAEFLQHLVRRPHVKSSAVFGIFESHSCHQDVSVYLVSRFPVVSVCSGYHRLAHLFTQLHYLPVIFLKLLLTCHHSLVYHELVVYQRLYFKIVVKLCDLLYLLLTFAGRHGTVHLTCFTGGTDDQTFPVLRNDRFRQPRPLVEIVEVRPGHQLVYIFESLLGLCQQDYMVRRFFLVVDASVDIAAVGIIEHITFHTIDDLYIHRILLVGCQFLRSFRCIREALHHAMVGYCHGRLPPGCSCLHQIRHFIESIHGAHLRMRMELHTLVFAGILPDFFLCFLYAVSHNGDTVIEPVPLSLSFDPDMVAVLQMCLHVLPLLVQHK